MVEKKISKVFEKRLMDTMERAIDVGVAQTIYGLPIELNDAGCKFPIYISKPIRSKYWEVAYPNTGFRVFHTNLCKALSIMVQRLIDNKRLNRRMKILKSIGSL